VAIAYIDLLVAIVDNNYSSNLGTYESISFLSQKIFYPFPHYNVNFVTDLLHIFDLKMAKKKFPRQVLLSCRGFLLFLRIFFS